MSIKTIFFITISNKTYIPFFKRNGPITQSQRVDGVMLEKFKNMGYNITVLGSEEIDTETGAVVKKLNKEEKIEEVADVIEEDNILGDVINESEEATEEIITEDEDSSDEEDLDDDDIDEDIKVPSKSEFAKMNVNKIIETLELFKGTLLSDDVFPLEGKTKKQLLEVASSICVE